MQQKSIRIKNIQLDFENPRHPNFSTTEKCVEFLVKSEKVYELAKDIVKQGMLSPIDLIGVIPHQNSDSSQYIVVEGNRRVCALMLLNDPKLAPQNEQSKYANLVKKSTQQVPKKLQCAVFNGREKADHWIRLRHEGAQDGIGTRTWTSEQKARHSQRQGRKSPNELAIKMIDFALAKDLITEAEKHSIVVTTIARYLNNPEFREFFGLGNRVDLASRHKGNDFQRLVGRFLKDSLKPKNDGSGQNVVHSRSNKAEWLEYIDGLWDEGERPPKKTGTLHNYEESSVKEDDSSDGGGSPPNFDRKSRITKKPTIFPFFGRTLLLKTGAVNNLYSDIKTLAEKHGNFSADFPRLIALNLRFLTETAAGVLKFKDIQKYIGANFANAKKLLDKNEREFLAKKKVGDEQSFIQTLQAAGHGYDSNLDLEVARAISLILGKMLELTHGRGN